MPELTELLTTSEHKIEVERLKAAYVKAVENGDVNGAVKAHAALSDFLADLAGGQGSGETLLPELDRADVSAVLNGDLAESTGQ
jgi:hypothetical protein